MGWDGMGCSGDIRLVTSNIIINLKISGHL